MARQSPKPGVRPAQGHDVGIREIDRLRPAASRQLMATRDQRVVGGREQRRAEQIKGSSRWRHADHCSDQETAPGGGAVFYTLRLD